MHGQCDILELTAEIEEHRSTRGSRARAPRADPGALPQVQGSGSPFSPELGAGHTAALRGEGWARRAVAAVLVELARDRGENILGCKNEAGDSAPHLAARHGHGATVEVLVSAAAEPAAELNNAGVSPLYLAVISGSVQAVRAITTCRHASSAGPSSQNALHAAVFQSSEMVHLLLEWRPSLADQVDSSGSSPFHFASSDGDRKIVNAILRASPSSTVYKKDSGGLSALHVAARMGHHRVVEDMLGSCPDAAELRDGSGGTFVHAAARETRSSAVVSLAIRSPMLRGRGLLDAQDRDGNTPLHLAVAAGSTDVVEALLRKGKVPADVLNNDGHTAFDLGAEGWAAGFFATISLVVALVAYGAQLRPQRQEQLEQWGGRDMCDILEVSAERNTALHVAAEQGHDELIQELYHRFREHGLLLSHRNSALDTPLHCEARAGHVRAVAVLAQLSRDCGESILGCRNKAGDTALHLTARHGYHMVVEALVSAAGPAAELNNAGVSPLYLAVMSGSVQAVKAITMCKDASSAGPSSQNALHAAVFQSSAGDRSIVHALLRAAPPTTVYKDSAGLSALHVAARMGHHRVAKDMLRSYPDAAELRDGNGGTFLHTACREKQLSVVSVVIKGRTLRGLLLDAHDRHGNTALHLAVAAGAPAVVEALLRKGEARVDVLNSDGDTAFELAAASTSSFTMGIQRTSDSLAVVAVLIATSAFAAGFNVPGGYSDATGQAHLARKKFVFDTFLFLDMFAVATSRRDPARLREDVALRRRLV
ncbi:unnamed protein product [Miscanthus lutarioriparius]|uniref:PGG domain-containing protein n=1 Tax=Miscanthus lutarioriparius TaxID=422564 RepID=A0A811QHN6_9POAL|nr:unnamed protein product [Miscanthus lutarioriparius]